MPEQTCMIEAAELSGEIWDKVRTRLGLTGLSDQLARKAKNVKFAEGGLVLMHLDWADRALAEAAYVSRLQDALSEMFGQDLYIGIEIVQNH